MPAEVLYDADADLSLLTGRRIAIIGYGSQGHAHALNLRESGFDVVVGVRPGSAGWRRAEADGIPPPAPAEGGGGRAEADGITPQAPAEAAEGADVIGIFVPDQIQAKLYADIVAPALRPG